MKTAEELLDFYIQDQGEYIDSDQKSVVIDAMIFYANAKLDEASDIALDFEKEIISEKILNLKGHE